MWAIEPHQPSTAEGLIKKKQKTQSEKKKVYLVDHFILVLLPQTIKNVHQEKKHEPVA